MRILFIVLSVSYVIASSTTFASGVNTTLSARELRSNCEQNDIVACETLFSRCEIHDLLDKTNLKLARSACYHITESDFFRYQQDQVTIAFNNSARIDLFQAEIRKSKTRKDAVNGVQWEDFDLYYITDDEYINDARTQFYQASKRYGYEYDFLPEATFQKIRELEVWYINWVALTATMSNRRTHRQYLSDIRVMQFTRPVRIVTIEDSRNRMHCIGSDMVLATKHCNILIKKSNLSKRTIEFAEQKITKLEAMKNRSNGDSVDLAFLDFSALEATTTKALKAFYFGKNEDITNVFGGDKVAAAVFVAKYSILHPTVCIGNSTNVYVERHDTIQRGVYVSGPLKGTPNSDEYVIPGADFTIEVLTGFADIVIDMRISAFYGGNDLRRFIEKSNLCSGAISSRLHRNMLSYYGSL